MSKHVSGLLGALENMVRIFGSPAELLKMRGDEYKSDALKHAKEAIAKEKGSDESAREAEQERQAMEGLKEMEGGGDGT